VIAGGNPPPPAKFHLELQLRSDCAAPTPVVGTIRVAKPGKSAAASWRETTGRLPNAVKYVTRGRSFGDGQSD